MSYQRRKEVRPEQIRAAALAVFAETGFAATKMSEIAARAGVSRATLYLYYANKEAIFEALVRQNMVPVITALAAGLEKLDGSAGALLERALGECFARVVHPEISRIVRLMITEGPQFPELAAVYKAEIIDPGRNILSQILQRGVQTGEFRAEAADLDPRVLIAPALLAVIWAPLFGAQDPLDMQKLTSGHIEVLMRGLAATPAMDTPPAETLAQPENDDPR